jgi:hypothetical protein
MSVPVTNEAYSQQNNQLFDWAKTATPQQIEAAKQGLPKDSPLLLAIGMGVQYQQQARAPRPQAPQGTILQQKLQEFQQTSPQGLPQVRQNQMAMQQTAQQNPMFGAGLAVAPENTEQAPQQMAATGGITALARGGEVRGFDGTDGSLAKLVEDENAVEDAATTEEDGIANEGKWFDNFAKQAKNTGTDLLDKYKAYTNTAPSAGLPSINLGGDPSSPYGQYEAPTLEAPISDMGMPTEQTSPKNDYRLSDMVAPKAKPKVKAHHSKKDTAPAPGSSAEANAASPTAKGETYQGLDKYLSKGVVNPSSYDADAVVASMLNKDTTPHLTAEESIAQYQKLLGPEADMSEEVGMARENAANARRDKGLGALVGGIGGMLSAQTPYMSQALGAGLMSGLSSYQSGAKEQGTADKELMALQMAQKKSDLAGHRAAAEAYIGQQAKMAEKEAEARAKREETMLGIRGNYGVEKLKNVGAMNIEQLRASQAQAIQAMKNMSTMEEAAFKAGNLSADKLAEIYGRGLQGGGSPEEIQEGVQGLMTIMNQYKGRGGASGGGSSNPFAPVGNSGVFYNQPKK